MATVHPESARNVGARDGPDVTAATPAEEARTVLINRISWGAVFAGVVIALVTQLILNLIGLGIGAASIDPRTVDNPSPSSLSLGAGVWWILSGIIAALAGGYTAGRLAGGPSEQTAAWHGLISWGFTTLVIFYLLTSTLGGIVGGGYQALTSVASGVGQTAGASLQTAVQAAAPALSRVTDPASSIEQAVRNASGGNDPAALRDAAASAVRALVTGDPQQVQAARDRAAEALAKAQNIPTEQARSQVEQYERQYREAVDQVRQQATRAAEVTTKAVSRAGFFGALALILGAVAAWFGGRMGVVDPIITLRRLTT
jgi:vacuolar-type H+-ATPase subunit H